jgi:hypothetical protein
MNKKLKSYYEWFFQDKIVLASPSLDEGSKRLGKVVSILCGSVLGGFLTVFILEENRISFYDRDVSNGIIGCFGAVLGVWITYRLVRIIFWVIDGFRGANR